MLCARCSGLVSVGLICACLAQGAKAPPAAVVGAIVGPVVTPVATNAVPSDQYVVDTVTGRIYQISGLSQRSPIVVMPSTTAMAPSTVITVASTSLYPSMTAPSTGAYDD
jgi:hypothetical protein